MKSSRIVAAILLAGFVGVAGMASGVAETGGKAPAAAKSGEVDFPISCSAPAQKKLDQAVGLHSFWYEEAVKAFTAVTEVEPDCAMGIGASR